MYALSYRFNNITVVEELKTRDTERTDLLLTEVVFYIIKDDAYKVSKQLEIRDWIRQFSSLINYIENVPVFLDILLDEDCWENTKDNIKLDRRAIIKRIIGPHIWKDDLLNDINRYQIACWYCLEEDIITLFECFKQKFGNEIYSNPGSLKMLADFISKDLFTIHYSRPKTTDLLVKFWSYFVSGYISFLDLKNQHPYVYGLDIARKYGKEAVEFFWNKIKSLPESELNAQEKDKVFTKTIEDVIKYDYFEAYPDVFEFCCSQITPDRYPELLKRDLEKNTYYTSLYTMLKISSIDEYQRLFDYLKLINDVTYSCNLSDKVNHMRDTIRNRSKDKRSFKEKSFNEILKLLTKCVYKCDSCAFSTCANKKTRNNGNKGKLLVFFVERGYMQLVWALLDKANPSQIKKFMSSKDASYICSILEQRQDEYEDNTLLNKFLAYGTSVDEDLSQRESIPLIHVQNYLR